MSVTVSFCPIQIIFLPIMVTTISQTWGFRTHIPHVGEEINTFKSGINTSMRLEHRHRQSWRDNRKVKYVHLGISLDILSLKFPPE
jgi:hypothetical protein